MSLINKRSIKVVATFKIVLWPDAVLVAQGCKMFCCYSIDLALARDHTKVLVTAKGSSRV